MTYAEAKADLDIKQSIFTIAQKELDLATNEAVAAANSAIKTIWEKHFDIKYPKLHDFSLSSGIHTDKWEITDIMLMTIDDLSPDNQHLFEKEATAAMGIKVFIYDIMNTVKRLDREE